MGMVLAIAVVLFFMDFFFFLSEYLYIFHSFHFALISVMVALILHAICVLDTAGV